MATTRRTTSKPKRAAAAKPKRAAAKPKRAAAKPARAAAQPKRAAAGTIHHASDATFDLLVGSAPAVLVDLWAPWCPPCLAMGPILKKVATTLGRKVTVVKVNVDENPELTRKFRVTSIPKLVLLHGARRTTHVGLLGEAALTAWVRKGLAAT